MPPYPRVMSSFSNGPRRPLEERDGLEDVSEETHTPKIHESPLQIVWRNVAVFSVLHIFALYGLYLAFTDAKWMTSFFAFFLIYLGGFGVTGGAHRLWSHRSYKATWSMKVFLLFCQTLAHQNCMIEWCRDHRVHHKFSETSADPHDARRGFFFAHMGWLLCKKHSEVKEKGKGIDVSDLYAEPLLRWQKKYFNILMPIICFGFPTVLPMVLWNETFTNAFCLNLFRYVYTLHGTWLVNSAAHMWGNKPYDKNISPTENPFVSIIASGEGWHNYHHAFPWDYRASEFGRLNLTLLIINLFAKIGWAYDLKTTSKEMIRNRVKRTGDGSHEIWGWGDKDQSPEHYASAVIYNKKDT